jgi:hypothetical protein
VHQIDNISRTIRIKDFIPKQTKKEFIKENISSKRAFGFAFLILAFILFFFAFLVLLVPKYTFSWDGLFMFLIALLLGLLGLILFFISIILLIESTDSEKEKTLNEPIPKETDEISKENEIEKPSTSNKKVLLILGILIAAVVGFKLLSK